MASVIPNTDTYRVYSRFNGIKTELLQNNSDVVLEQPRGTCSGEGVVVYGD
jgi:hypothetical protein